MKAANEPKRLQFSKLPLSNPRVLDQKKTFQNLNTSTALTPSASCKKVTFGARVTNLSSSSISMLSSRTSLSYQSNLTLSRTSFDSQRILPSDDKHSFSQLRMFQRVQPFRNDENEPPLILIKKTQSNYAEDYENQNSGRLTEKYGVKPVFEASVILETQHQNQQQSVDPRLGALLDQIASKDIEISTLKSQLQRNRLQHQQSLIQNQSQNHALGQTIQELNLIIFELRNTKEYQKDVICMLQEKERGITLEKQELVSEIETLKQDKYQLWESNRSLQIVLESLEQKQSPDISSEILSTLESKSKITQLQKTISLQNNTLKSLRSDLKSREERIDQLQDFIDDSNLEVIKDHLTHFNNQMMRLQPIQDESEGGFQPLPN